MRRVIGSLLLALLVAIVACGGDDDEHARAQVEDSPTTLVEDGPDVGDHWHVAFEASVCGNPLPHPRDAVPDKSGIHTHGDGLIHVHPFGVAYSGAGAVLGAFFETIGAEVDGRGLTIAGETIVFAGVCDGAPAHLEVATWTAPEAEPTQRIVSGDDLLDVPLAPDGAAIAVGLVREGEQLALPASTSELSAPADVAPPATGEGTPAGDVVFGLAPVLGIDEPPCSETATAGEEGAACYELGPVRIDGDAIASAEAVFDGLAGWAVSVMLTTDGDTAFDEAARECFDRTDGCPSGQLAIVVEGEVLSAPTVQTPSFDGELQISGDFTEAEAKELAAALSP